MTTYRLISFKACPWVQRAAIVLREKAIDFEFVHIESGDRPSWFGAISPHGKVPVLQIDNGVALFESNAISEYLDETIAPRLHPEDPVARAINRAWIDYLPTFTGLIGGVSMATSKEALADGREKLSAAFGRVEEALAKQGDGLFFNGARYALIDAGYAPFLQRHLIVEALSGDRISHGFPRLRQWAEALAARPTTHTFVPDVFRALYIEILQRRGSLIAQRALAA